MSGQGDWDSVDDRNHSGTMLVGGNRWLSVLLPSPPSLSLLLFHPPTMPPCWPLRKIFFMPKGNTQCEFSSLYLLSVDTMERNMVCRCSFRMQALSPRVERASFCPPLASLALCLSLLSFSLSLFF